MPWQCKLLDIVGTVEVSWEPPEGGGKSGETRLLGLDGKEYSYDTLMPGTMFFLPKEPVRETRATAEDKEFIRRSTPWPWYWAEDDWLSDYYRQNNAHRQPLFVVLPGRHLFLVDGKCFKDGEKYGGMDGDRRSAVNHRSAFYQHRWYVPRVVTKWGPV